MIDGSEVVTINTEQVLNRAHLAFPLAGVLVRDFCSLVLVLTTPMVNR